MDTPRNMPAQDGFMTTIGPVRNQLGVDDARIRAFGATITLALMWSLAAISLKRGAIFDGGFALFLGVFGVFVALVLLVRIDAAPIEFSAGPKGIILRYDFPTLRTAARLEWGEVRVRTEPLVRSKFRLTILHSGTRPRKAVLDMDEVTFSAVSSLLPRDVRRF
jgi:hypothetical protein